MAANIQAHYCMVDLRGKASYQRGHSAPLVASSNILLRLNIFQFFQQFEVQIVVLFSLDCHIFLISENQR